MYFCLVLEDDLVKKIQTSDNESDNPEKHPDQLTKAEPKRKSRRLRKSKLIDELVTIDSGKDTPKKKCKRLETVEETATGVVDTDATSKKKAVKLKKQVRKVKQENKKNLTDEQSKHLLEKEKGVRITSLESDVEVEKDEQQLPTNVIEKESQASQEWDAQHVETTDKGKTSGRSQIIRK